MLRRAMGEFDVTGGLQLVLKQIEAALQRRPKVRFDFEPAGQIVTIHVHNITNLNLIRN